jgi:hypothetical protein
MNTQKKYSPSTRFTMQFSVVSRSPHRTDWGPSASSAPATRVTSLRAETGLHSTRVLALVPFISLCFRLASPLSSFPSLRCDTACLFLSVSQPTSLLHCSRVGAGAQLSLHVADDKPHLDMKRTSRAVLYYAMLHASRVLFGLSNERFSTVGSRWTSICCFQRLA